MGSRIIAFAFVAYAAATWAQPRVLAQPLGEAAAPPLVAEVELRLPLGVDEEEIRALLAISAGQPFSKRDVQRSLERLYATGRFADILVRKVDVPSGWQLIFELFLRKRLGAVSAEGNVVLTTAEVLRASGLVEGEEYYAERLRRAILGVQAAYAAAGREVAKVTADISERGERVSVKLSVDEGPATRLAAVTVTGSPGLPLPEILKELGMAPGDVLDWRLLESGLERLSSHYRAKGYFRSRIGEPLRQSTAEGAVLALPIFAGPAYTFHFHGNKSFDEGLLRRALRYDGSDTLDVGMATVLAKRLAVFYQSRGFQDVRVSPRLVESPDHTRAVLAFDIEEGRWVKVEKVELAGNQSLRESELLALVADAVLEQAPDVSEPVPNEDPLETEGRDAGQQVEEGPPELTPLQTLRPEAYPEAALAIEALYREQGFRKAEVKFEGTDVDVSSGLAKVRFAIVEGPRTFVGKVTVSGLPPGIAAPPENAWVGTPLGDFWLEQRQKWLLGELSRKGYLFAKLDVAVKASADSQQADIAFEVEPGPEVKAGKIIVQGISRTDVNLVTANLDVQSGKPLNPDALTDGQRRLSELGLFKQVGVRLISPEVSEPVKDVVVDLKERPRMLAEVGGGYFLVDGPRVVGDVTFPNLGGRGTTVSGRGKINYVGASAPAASGQLKDVQGFRGLGGRANVAIQQPRFYSLLPLEIGGRVDLIGERVFSPSYRFARGAAVLGADWTLTRWLTFSLQYELEYDVVRAPATISRLLPTLTRLEQERLRFPVGEFAIHSLRPQLLFDFRDNPFNPRSGYLFSLTTEFSHDLYTRLTDASGQPLRDASGAEQQFPILTAKVVAQATAYAPLGSRVVLAVSARAGRIYTLNDNPNVLGPKRFFLGGGATMRGFREDGVIPADTRRRLRQQLTACRSVVNPYGCASEADVLQAGDEIPSEGGTLFTLGKVELRIPVVRSLSLGLFGEAGNLWADPALFSFWELRYVLGTGLRFETPIGPLAFDVGFNIDPDRLLNEPTFNINFGVGVF